MKSEREAPKSDCNFEALQYNRIRHRWTTSDGRTGGVLLRLREPLRLSSEHAAFEARKPDREEAHRDRRGDEAGVNRDCDAFGARPSLFIAGHAMSTKRLSEAFASGAISVATTSRPLARKSAVQLAPMTPVPIMATRRMGLVSVMSFLRCVCQISA